MKNLDRRYALILGFAGAVACGETPAEPPVIAAVQLSERSVTLERGEATVLHATARAADGTPQPGAVITWHSSDPSVVAVSASGAVTGMAWGTARVRAEVAGRFDEATVEVLPVEAADIAGTWFMRSFDAHQVPALYAVYHDEPVGGQIVALVEIYLDSAGMRQDADGTYRRSYCFSEEHDGVRAASYCWGDHGRFTVGTGANRGRITFASEYIQHLVAQGVVRGDVTQRLIEPLYHGESPRQTVWERR